MGNPVTQALVNRMLYDREATKDATIKSALSGATPQGILQFAVHSNILDELTRILSDSDMLTDYLNGAR